MLDTPSAFPISEASLARARNVSRQTLVASVPRAVAFLGAVKIHAPLARTLAREIAFDDAEQERGWSLCRTVASADAPDSDVEALVEAVAACERFLGEGFVRARGILQLYHPDAARAAVDRVSATTQKLEAVMAVQIFVENCRALPADDGAPSRSRGPRAALASVGVDDRELDRLSGLVAAASGLDREEAPRAFRAGPNGSSEDRRERDLARVYVWITAWSEMARTVVTRKDDLIRLGLAKKKPPKGKGEGGRRPEG